MKLLCFFILSLVVFSCSNPIEEHIKLGDKLFQEKKFKESIEEYTNAIKLDSSRLDIFGKRSLAKKEAMDLWGSMEDHFYAGLIDTNNMAELLFRGDMYLNSGKLNLAYKDFSKVLEKNPFDGRALMSRAFINFETKNFEESHQDYSNALKTWVADTAEVYFRRGKVKIFLNDTLGAINDFSQAIKISPNGYSSYLTRGMAYQLTNQLDKALQDLQYFNNKVPNYIKAMYKLAQVNKKLKNLDEALLFYNKVVSLKPNHIGALRSLGSIYFVKGSYQKSLSFYQKVLQIDNSDDDANYMASYNCNKLGDKENMCKYLLNCSKTDKDCDTLYNQKCLKQ